MAGFDEVPFELIAERNHFCNLIANQQNAAISICRQVYLQGSQLFFMIVSIFFQMYALLKYYKYALTKNGTLHIPLHRFQKLADSRTLVDND